MIARAIRRPYGWGWDAGCRGESAGARRPTSRPIDLQPLGSPAAGVVLYWSGKFLQQPKYVDAATQVARGIAAAQIASGKVPTIPSFAASTAGGREEPALVPDRASTRASLALLLTLLDGDSAKEERFKGAAIRAAHWLSKQQSNAGGFISCWPLDAGPEQGETAVRIIRLADNDYRDSAIALLLTSAALSEKPAEIAARKAIEQLVSLQISNAHDRGNGLWIAAYSLSGEPKSELIGCRNGADVLASRYAMQTILASYLITGDRNLGLPIDNAIKSLQNLRRADLEWDRFPDSPDEPAATSAPVPIFATSQPATRPLEIALITRGAFGLPELFHEITQLKLTGRDRYLALMPRDFDLHEQFAATLVGLSDDPFAIDFPLSRKEVDAYLDKHADLWRLLEGPGPETLTDRVRRLWALLLRARVERLKTS